MQPELRHRIIYAEPLEDPAFSSDIHLRPSSYSPEDALPLGRSDMPMDDISPARKSLFSRCPSRQPGFLYGIIPVFLLLVLSPSRLFSASVTAPRFRPSSRRSRRLREGSRHSFIPPDTFRCIAFTTSQRCNVRRARDALSSKLRRVFPYSANSAMRTSTSSRRRSFRNDWKSRRHATSRDYAIALLILRRFFSRAELSFSLLFVD